MRFLHQKRILHLYQPTHLRTYEPTNLQVRFLHQKRILHRDLKPENLLYKDNDPGAPLKVIGFGLAVLMEPTQP
jgi:serine/threonine protein kinase